MKFFVLFFLLSLSVSATTYSQDARLTLSMENVSLTEVFSTIRKNTSFTFIYNVDDVRNLRVKSLNVKDATVQQVLDEALQGLGFIYRIEDKVIVIQPQEVKEEKKSVRVKGRVSDESKAPLPGVTITVKGLSLGTVTDKDGKFSLNLPEMGKLSLVFSFIGMESQTIAYTGQDSINVVMKEDVATLEEVTVVSDGYRDIDPRMTTSAITSVRADDIVVPGITTIDKMLEGRIPGMTYMLNSGQVGAVPRLRIRGTSSVLGNQEPLWVVDGIVQRDPVNVDPQRLNDLDFVNLLGNAISGLNPEDIEQIDVLKDASATAIYGTKASNGVIVITTKKGKQGPPSVGYSFAATLTRRPHYGEKSVNMMNSMERVALSRELMEAGVLYPSIDSWVGYEAVMRDYYNKLISYEEMKRLVNKYETINTDWFELLTRDAFMHSHTINLSGGSSHLKYYVSAGMQNNQGNNLGEVNRTYTTATNINATYDRFTIRFGLNGSVEKRKYRPSDVGAMTYAYQISRAVPAYNEDGSYAYYNRSVSGGEANVRFNILEDIANSFYNINTNKLSFSTAVTYRITEDWNVNGTFAYSFSNSYQDTYHGENTYFTRTYKYPNGERNAALGEANFKQSTTVPYGGILDEEDQQNTSYTIRLQSTYNKYLDEDRNHHINVTAGWELASSRYLGTKKQVRGYLPDRGKQIAQVDLDEFPRLKEWYRDDEMAVGKYTDNLTNTVSGYASFSYTMFSDYTFNVNARADASNKFGSNSNDKILPIWSVSGRWDVKNSLLRGLNFVNEFTLRSSFGYQGNMLETESPEMILKRGSYSARFGEFVSTMSKFANPNLKWEKTSSFNLSLDFSFLKGHLSGVFSYFYRKTTNAFLAKQVSYVEGINSYTVNQGTVTNKGIELALRVRLIDNNLGAISQGKADGFRWDFDPGLGQVVNNLVDKAINGNGRKDRTLHDEYKYDDYLNGNVQIPGRALNSFYSYRFKGLDPKDGRPMFYGAEQYYTVDGQEVLDDGGNKILNDKRYEEMTREDVILGEIMSYSGKRVPVIQGNVSNTFSWKRMILSVNLSYSLGSKIRLLNMYEDVSQANNSIAPVPLESVRREWLDRWRHPGDENFTNIPGILSGNEYVSTINSQDIRYWRGKPYEFAGTIWDMYNYADIRVVRGDYLKLQSLSFRYNLPEQICRKIFLKTAYVGFSATNLFTICSKKLKGQSPTQSGGSGKEINMSERPSFSLNFNVTF
ncbi:MULTISPECIES: SusC/RagA family TonB-linked outer membrane protein [Butyricimonas]|uniref:SusC/RagA family TonB-linked outer membrane protein n=1 Tax=Butyricimonas TaxID=574697 RepID=UPI001E454B90|nr:MULTISPECIES: SusC/RagA family TonB-linked outer membrane protein [Butyricimonas]